MTDAQETQGAEPEVAEAQVVDAVVIPRKRRVTNAEHAATRAERKAKAAPVIKANASKAAAAKKKALAKAPSNGQEAFVKRAKEIEARINKPKAEAEDSK